MPEDSRLWLRLWPSGGAGRADWGASCHTVAVGVAVKGVSVGTPGASDRSFFSIVAGEVTIIGRGVVRLIVSPAAGEFGLGEAGDPSPPPVASLSMGVPSLAIEILPLKSRFIVRQKVSQNEE